MNNILQKSFQQRDFLGFLEQSIREEKKKRKNKEKSSFLLLQVVILINSSDFLLTIPELLLGFPGA